MIDSPERFVVMIHDPYRTSPIEYPIGAFDNYYVAKRFARQVRREAKRVRSWFRNGFASDHPYYFDRMGDFPQIHVRSTKR